MKGVLDFGKGVTALGLRLTQAVLNAVYAVVAALCRLLGVRPPSVPQITPPAATPASVMDRFESALDRKIERTHTPVSDIGAAVHQYASARDPYIRGAVDLTCLSAAQAGWLMGLSDADLERLAAAGPVACQRAVTGKRSGIVGLPEMRPAGVVEAVPADPRERVRDALRERIMADRGRRLAA
ncbi:MAG: hypothetical protein KF723_03280 [Rhizobiaceae bacterium]|nr:hypothetical protein [Rhizobiaceae bacterium]